MILFHGTNKENANKIFREKCISISEEKNWRNSSCGYTYLSNDIIKALYYGSNACSKEHFENIVLFKVNIPYNLLKPDFDEAECQRLEIPSSNNEEENLKLILDKCKSTRIDFSIFFSEVDIEYCEIEVFDDNGNEVLRLNDEKYEFKEIVRSVNCGFKERNEIYTLMQNKFVEKIQWRNYEKY